MAIFDKSDKQADYASNVTTIAAGTSVVGKIDIECNLHIDGEFEGEVSSKSIVKIGQSGLLKSTLKAEKLIVTGRFIGTADCDTIELVSGGEAEGKLISSGLTIDSSSSFQGESIRRKKGEVSKVLDFSSDKPSLKPSLDPKPVGDPKLEEKIKKT
ncbi:MAG: polymer-forming cytoskeletal protein [Arenicellales bacterium]